MKRIILRWVHIIFGLPLIGLVYSASADTEPYRPIFQYFFMPVLLITGLWMWKGHWIERLIWKKPASEA
ncbi:hypothetical protein [Anatilimnocola floriformis]|uniref:hypothetical protein n=1 Tax=Anatilimnocola floriformis TaxID=2948575 RepID=UPI0020C3EC14|nr:hypothetical protein [Anatilimnocola floriformis]